MVWSNLDEESYLQMAHWTPIAGTSCKSLVTVRFCDWSTRDYITFDEMPPTLGFT